MGVWQNGIVSGGSPPDSFANFCRVRAHLSNQLVWRVVVVEAEERSGTAAAVRVALKQGRPVGLLRSLVESEDPACGWAAQLVEMGQAFVVAETEDVVKRVSL